LLLYVEIKTIFVDVSEYWKRRGPNYQKELEEKSKSLQLRFEQQEKIIKKLILKFKPKSILEIGCGSGRFTKIIFNLTEIEKYLAIDISQSQIDNAKKYTNNNKIHFQCVKVQDLDINEKFDLVFSSEVLMHINFHDIDSVIKKIISLAKKKVITIDWFDSKKIGEESGGYCFLHNYYELYKKHGGKEIIVHDIPLPLSLKLIDKYSKIRGRHGFEKQSIFEINV
jgi:SAM-dependent methyltransferase